MASIRASSADSVSRIVATCFGIGLLPKAPGTWGSLAALPFAWAIQWAGGPLALAAAAIVLFLVGWRAADSYSAATGRDDPREVVVDEVVGQWLAVLPAGLDPVLYAAGFVLFRIADIWKPWPVGWADRAVPGGLGIMLDDVFAGGYAVAVLALVVLMTGGDGVF